MQLHLIGVCTPHLRDLLPTCHVLPFFHEQLAIVCVHAEVGVVVLDDDELAEAAYARAAEDDSPRRACEHRLPRFAADCDALACVVIAGGGQQTTGGTFSLDGTIGQAIAGNASSGSQFALSPGFWNLNALAPTAAGTSISGRVKTESGKGIRNVTLILTNATGESFYAQSGVFGGYRFEDLPTGQSYVLTVSARRFSFVQNTRFIMLLEELTNVDFIGVENFR